MSFRHSCFDYKLIIYSQNNSYFRTAFPFYLLLLILLCLTLKTDRLSYPELNIATSFVIITKSYLHIKRAQSSMIAHPFLEWRKDWWTLECILYGTWQFMVYLYRLLFFLKNFLDYEKIDKIIQILKRHKLNSPQPVAIFTPKSFYEWSLRWRQVLCILKAQ